MVDEATTDMMMKFQRTSGGPVPAECPLSISPNDKLALSTELAPGFAAGKYFLVSQFSFGAEIHDDETGPGAGKGVHGVAGGRPGFGAPQGRAGYGEAVVTRGGALGRGVDHFDQPGTQGGAGAGGKGAPYGAGGRGTQAGRGGAFARWRSATGDSWKQAGAYPAYINEFSFTRLIDMASPVLFDFCCRKEAFPFVTFIKRKAAVTRASPLPESLAYLRIDLASVLLTSIRWSDGDIMEETCQMTCQKMRIIYWQQNADSTLTPIGSVDWTSPVMPPSSSGS